MTSSSTGQWISAGALFVATALASQWLQRGMRNNRSSSDLEYSSDEERRRHRREQRRIRRKRRQMRERREAENTRHLDKARDYPTTTSIDEHHDENDHGDSDESDDDGYNEDPSSGDYIQQSMYMAPTTQPLVDGFDHPSRQQQLQEIFNPYQQQDPHSPLNDYKEYYKLRRLEDRMSFDNLRPLFHSHVESTTAEVSSVGTPAAGVGVTAVATVLDGTNRSFQAMSLQNQAPANQNQLPQGPTTAQNQQGSDSHRQKSKSATNNKHRRHVRGHRSVADREDDYDFLPKNSNWNHFERYNEEDFKLGLVKPGTIEEGAMDASHNADHQHHQPFSNGYNHGPYVNQLRSSTLGMGSDPDLMRYDIETEEDPSSTRPNHNNEEEDIPDDNSSSSEEQFVWTEALHAHSKARCQGKLRYTTIGGSNKDSQPSDSPDDFPSPLPVGGGQDLGHAQNGMRKTSGHGRNSKMGTLGSPSISRSTSYSELSADSSATPRLSQQQCQEQQSRQLNQSHHAYQHHISRRTARAQYNAKIMPNKVVMIRHGQSMGNINEELYSTTPDNAMPLTKLGFEQARAAGQNLRKKVLAEGETVHFIVSPYVRTVETFHGIVSAWCDPKSPEFAHIENREERLKAWYGRLLEMGLTWHEDPRIREQDFGNYQDPLAIRKAKQDRRGFGVFYYRFAHGESASDVFDRVSTFLDSLWRSFDMNRSRNYVLVTHGISIRVLLARYFRYTIHQFNMLANPRNCEMLVMGHDGDGRLRLEGRYQLHLKQRVVEQEKSEDDNNPKPEAAEGEEKSISATTESPAVDQNGGANTAEVRNESALASAPGATATTRVVTEVGDYKFYKRLRVLPKAAIQKVPIRVCYD